MLKKTGIIMIAAGVFCAGVLLGGIGTGVAIAEYTNLEYSGQHNLGEENMKTENLDVTVTPMDGQKIIVRHNYFQEGRERYDESIPMNTVRYVVRYNTELVSLWAGYEEFEEKHKEEYEGEYGEEEEGNASEELAGEVYMNWAYIGDEFDLVMRNKDKILSDLKQGKVGSYQTISIESVEIWMNPEMKPFVDVL